MSLDIPSRVIQRVWSKVAMGPGGCHLSTYSVASHGYAQVGWQEDGARFLTLVHRVVWIAQNGPIEEGMTVDHLCKNRRCIRLSHLRLISNLDNARRTGGRDWPIGQCINGHPDDENWVSISAGISKGYCRKCKAAQQIRYRLAHPEKYREKTRRSNEKRRQRGEAA